MEDDTLVLITARVWQPVACLGLLASIALSAVALSRAVHNEVLGAWLDRKWVQANGTANQYSRVFLDTEDRVVLQDLAELDPSSGGVYFFGASNMKWAMRTPDLPQAQRRLVHDFGAGEGLPYFHEQFTRFLFESKRILRAGPDKTLIVYGAGFVNAEKFRRDDPAAVFPHMWERYGLYRYDDAKGIEPLADGAPWSAYFLEKARGSSLVHGLIERAGRLALPKALRRRNTRKDPAAYAADYERRMGPDWEAAIGRQREELQRWLDYVRSRHANFAVVLLPLASWHRRLPYPAKYRAMLADFCRVNGVPLVDLSRLLADDDFLDHIHVNSRGLPKTDAALMAVARRFLESKGTWPKPIGRLPQASVGP